MMLSESNDSYSFDEYAPSPDHDNLMISGLLKVDLLQAWFDQHGQYNVFSSLIALGSSDVRRH